MKKASKPAKPQPLRPEQGQPGAPDVARRVNCPALGRGRRHRRASVSIAIQPPGASQPACGDRRDDRAARSGRIGRIGKDQVERFAPWAAPLPTWLGRQFDRPAPSAATLASIAFSAAGHSRRRSHGPRPRDSASSPSAPLPGIKVGDPQALEAAEPAGEHREERLARPVGGRPGLLARRRDQLPPTPFAGDDPHLRVWRNRNSVSRCTSPTSPGARPSTVNGP